MTMPNFDAFELYKIAVLFEVGDITARCNTESLTEMTTKMTLIRKATLLRPLINLVLASIAFVTSVNVLGLTMHGVRVQHAF